MSSKIDEGNEMILKESMNEMNKGAENINKTSADLSDISTMVKTSIQKIGEEIDQFKA